MDDPQKLGNWMKQEGAKVTELSTRLREHIVSIPSGSLNKWLEELGQRFEHFAAHYRRMVHIQEEDGYLQPVVELRPTLSKQVDALRRENEQLRRLMDDLQRTLGQLAPEDHLLIRDTCTRLQIFLGHVQRHQEHEHHIVLYTFNQEMGMDH